MSVRKLKIQTKIQFVEKKKTSLRFGGKENTIKSLQKSPKKIIYKASDSDSEDDLIISHLQGKRTFRSPNKNKGKLNEAMVFLTVLFLISIVI